MATDAGELIVKISADISDMKTALKQVADGMQSVSATTVAKGNIMADVMKKIALATVDFVKDSILAFAEHEQAVTRLSLAIGKDGAEALEKYANELQRTTAFSDDAILSLENQLVQYGIYPGSVKTATAALLDFSARTGKDLPEAGQMLAKAMAGQSRELKNYGIDVSLTASRSQNLATVTKVLEDRYSGAAAVMKGTTMGAIESLSNSFEDLKKRIGQDLQPVTNKFIATLQAAMPTIETIIFGSRTFSETIEDQKNKLQMLVQKARDMKEMQHYVSDEVQKAIKVQVDHIAALKKAAAAHDENKGAVDREIAAIRSLKDEIQRLQQEQQHLTEITALGTQKRILSAQLELAQLSADQKQITAITELETQKRLLTSQASWEANASFSDQFKVKLADDLNHNTAAFSDMAMSGINSFSQSTAKMIMEGGRFRDVMTSLWKNLAEQVIAQIIRMIAEWMIWEAVTGGVGPGNPFSFLGHGAGGGMINEPSMVIGMRSGTSFVAGEAGPEAFGPAGTVNTLNKGAAASAMGGSGGGGGGDVHIHISGQFIDGSPSKWQRMVQEQIIPQLRRFSMKDPVGVINRKRGAMA